MKERDDRVIAAENPKLDPAVPLSFASKTLSILKGVGEFVGKVVGCVINII
jgi:hypothetical protein